MCVAGEKCSGQKKEKNLTCYWVEYQNFLAFQNCHVKKDFFDVAFFTMSNFLFFIFLLFSSLFSILSKYFVILFSLLSTLDFLF
jgi:hypothetical protein